MKLYEGLTFTHLRVRLGLVFIIVLLLIARPHSPFLFTAGFAISLLGEAVRIWSSGHLRKSKELATSGPYAYTRNPLYIGSFLIGLGFCVASTSFDNRIPTMTIWLCFVIGFYLIYAVQISREEQVLSEKFSEEFKKYRKEVPPFIPTLTAYGNRSKNRFSFDLFRKNHEYRMTFVVILIYLILLFKEYLIQVRG